ncbi:MAG: acyltransferase [Thermodesulfobacteriota bacterium]|nr:acyltransferase [Thermodesulfobacteriota bacterium]
MNAVRAGAFILLEKLFRWCIHARFRGYLIRLFGARIGRGVRINEVIFSGFWNGFRNLSIGDNVFIGDGTFIDLTGRVSIGSRSSISPRCVLMTHEDPGSMLGSKLSTLYSRRVEEIQIGNDAWIGAGVIILCGISIGKGVVVGAGSLVNKDIPDNCVAHGTPAVVIKKNCHDNKPYSCIKTRQNK